MKKLKTSKSGYKRNSPDKNEPALKIPSGRITMKDVDHPILGVDNFGNSILMSPGEEYLFPGSEVTEVPMQMDMKKGGLTPNKAREILHDKKVHGKKLTDKQRKFFGAMSKGNTMNYLEGGEVNEMKKGGIHIKPENKGKFTDYCGGNVTQECISKGKNSKDPAVRKRAIFAANARKWKHQLGGPAQMNAFNLAMNKVAEALQSREDENYQNQMGLLMNQPSTQYLTRQQQYGNPFVYQIGGVIPEDISYMTPTFDTPTFAGASPKSQKVASGAAASGPLPPNVLSSDFTGYASKANKYLKVKAPKTDVTGEMLAAGAQEAFQKYGKVVPVELALAQLQQEGYLSGNEKNRPRRTKNPFNVGNTDPDKSGPGKTTYHNSIQSGINTYYNLIARSYLKRSTPEQLLENFVNASGNRYAGDPKYEQSLKKHISEMKFKKGGEYEVSDADIQKLKEMGYEFETIS